MQTAAGLEKILVGDEDMVPDETSTAEDLFSGLTSSSSPLGPYWKHRMISSILSNLATSAP